MHAPTACIFGFAPPSRLGSVSLRKNAPRSGLNLTAVWVGRNSALRSRAFPAFDSRVLLRTLVPLLNSRGDRPQYAAALSAEGSRSTAGSSARIVVAVR